MSNPLESRVEEILQGQTIVPQSRVEVLLESLVQQVNELSSATRWIGVTTTVIYDGSTTRSIVVDGKTKSAKAGDICSYNDVEYIWSGSAWQEFGKNVVPPTTDGTYIYKATVSSGTATYSWAADYDAWTGGNY